ncbi:unnamed protein product [Amoebophrya sp. A25]|nr:unnamed protein product [Amoebophrya sp. A25]|eukprot:GSA25T00013326001.1
MDHEFASLSWAGLHNNAKVLAVQREKLDEWHPHVNRNAALSFVGTGIVLSSNDEEKGRSGGTDNQHLHLQCHQGARTGRLAAFSFYDGRAVGKRNLKSPISNSMDEENNAPPVDKGDRDRAPRLYEKHYLYMRFDVMYPLLGFLQGALRRNFLRVMHESTHRMLFRRRFLPTHVFTLCPYFHRMMSKVPESSGRENEKPVSDQPVATGTTRPGEQMTRREDQHCAGRSITTAEKSIQFLRMPLMTKNVFRFGSPAGQHEDVEGEHREKTYSDDAELFNLVPTAKPAALQERHLPLSERPVDLFYAGNSLADLQREIFLPKITLTQYNRSIDLHDSEEKPLVFQLFGNNQARLASKYMGEDFQTRFAEQGVSLKIEPDDSEKQHGDEEKKRKAATASTPDMQDAENSSSYEYKLRLYGQARVCFTHNLVNIEPRETRFIRDWLSTQWARREHLDQLANPLFRDFYVAEPKATDPVDESLHVEQDIRKELQQKYEEARDRVDGMNMIERKPMHEGTQTRNKEDQETGIDTISSTDMIPRRSFHDVFARSKKLEDSGASDRRAFADFSSQMIGVTPSATTSADSMSPDANTPVAKHQAFRLRRSDSEFLTGFPHGRPVARAPQLKARGFEAALGKCLHLVLADHWSLLEEYFQPGKHFLYVSSIDEALHVARLVRRLYAGLDGDDGQHDRDTVAVRGRDNNNSISLFSPRSNQILRRRIEAMIEDACLQAQNYTFSWLDRELDRIL